MTYDTGYCEIQALRAMTKHRALRHDAVKPTYVIYTSKSLQQPLWQHLCSRKHLCQS